MSTDHGGAMPAIKRLVVGFMAALVMLLGAQTVIAAPSQAESTGYYGRECSVKALSGEGLAGNGCNSYGPAHWIPGDSGSPQVASWIQACVTNGSQAVLEIPFAKTNSYTLAGSTFLGCVFGAGIDLITNGS